jgi:hypothetical protein
VKEYKISLNDLASLFEKKYKDQLSLEQVEEIKKDIINLPPNIIDLLVDNKIIPNSEITEISFLIKCKEE